MGMAAILAMWPEPFEQIFVPLSDGDSIRNLASIGLMVSEEMFENVDNIHKAYLYCKLTYKPKARVS